MRQKANLTVGSVLSLGALRGAELLVGQRGLDRRVAGVNIIEVPDVARWLHGQEFLLTSAYLWRDRPGDLCRLLVKLDELGVAALGHKPSQHLARLPDDVLEVADQLGFPIVQLPDDLAYRDVFEGIYMLRFGHHRSSLRPDLAAQLGLDPGDHSMAEAVARLAREFQWVEVVDQLEGLVHTGDAQGEVRSQPLPATTADDEAALGLREDHEPHQVTDDETAWWVAPLVVDGQIHGRLTVAAEDVAVDLPLVMEMTDLLSLLQIRRRSYQQGLHGALDLTFRALVRGTLGEAEIVERARDLRLVEGGRWWLGMVHVDGPSVDEERVAQLRRALERQVPPAITVLGADHPGEPRLVLIARGDEASRDEAVASLRELVTPPARLRVGWSACADHPRKMPVSFREARIALEVCDVSEGPDVATFDRLGAEAVIAQVPRGELVDSFVADRVGKLEDEELVRTLELYVAHQGNKTATANAIPMHRSGLLYRLNKISELLGVDLEDPEVLNEMWLAFKLRWLQGIDG